MTVSMALPVGPVVLDTFRDAAEVHAPAFQIIYQSQQVAGVTPQPVQLPHHDLIAVS